MVKIQISVNVEIILFILIFIIIKQIKIYAIFILFTLLHELAHAVIGVILGLIIKKISIMPFGFKIIFKESTYKTKKEIKKLMTILAGPFINLIIMTLAIVLKLSSNIIYANLIIAVFNLIPIYPLDGGRILKSILKININIQKTNKIVNTVSNLSIIVLTIITSILILYIKNISILIVLGYLWYIVIRENKKYKLLKRMYDIIENTI